MNLYNKDFSLFKEIHLNTSFLCGTKVEFNDEIIKYHIMKNKIYIITENLKKKVAVYNVMKLAKIHEFPDSSLEKMVEILSKYDNVTLKSWFTVDIKLGTICLTFNKDNSFNNYLNFHTDYLEKIIDKVNSLQSEGAQPLITDLANLMKFYLDPQKISLDSTTLSGSGSQHSYTLGGTSKKVLTYSDKISSNGYFLFKNIFSVYILNRMTKILEYVDNNFEDKKGLLRGKILNEDDNKSEKSADKSLTSSMMAPKTFPNIFIYSGIDNNISIGPYLKEVSSNYILPSFLKELFNLVI